MKRQKMNVRFEKITINNFKNVKNGVLEFSKIHENNFSFSPSLVGIYGQNGSGKTTAIQVVDIIKRLLMGQSLTTKDVNTVSVDSDNCTILVEFQITNNMNLLYKVKYFVLLSKVDNVVENTILQTNIKNEKKLVVSKETLSASCIDLSNEENNIKLVPLINSNNNDLKIAFTPKIRLNKLTNDSEELQRELIINKKVSYDKSKSFIFDVNTLSIFRNKSNDKLTLDVIENLVTFANSNLFVIKTQNSGLINLNAALPINFKISNKHSATIGSIPINLTGTSLIPEFAYNIGVQLISNMNTVLEKLLPNLNVMLEKIGQQNDENGNTFVQVQLYSIRENKKISMANESEGIKKIVSVLQLLIVMFNNPSTTVAIDELDSGIFEYLLGELLRIISKQAKGQLIFTSHNLRALETIDKKFVYFTTTNENNRYVKMAYVSKNNNLRDFYFHELLLGGQKEELYEQTNNGAIALAFKKAGESIV